MAASKAPTPRTSRNSRGLRNTPLAGGTAIVRRSSRRNTPTSAQVAESFTELPEPSTPTPVARSLKIQTPFPQPSPAESPNHLEPVTLAPIQEEQAPKTPAAASPINATHQQASTTPVSSYTPTGSSTFTPPTQRKVSPLQHRRVALIKGTPLRPAKKTDPETPIYRPTRFLTRLVDRTPTPKPPPTPQSEGHETRRFAERRAQEDDDVEFARGIYLAIRNDHRMRECWCPIPSIYNSREEAEAGSGHFRFYIEDSQGPRCLRVLQKKDDSNWHCICAQEYHPVCLELLNKNGKRPAQDSELDLIAQNLGLEDGDNFEKVVTTLSEPTTAGEKPEQLSQWSMWTQARGFISSVATMASPFTNLISRIVGAVRADAYDTVDVRHMSQQDGTLVVKRFKRQLGRQENDEIDSLTWVNDPTDHIGRERLERLAKDFVDQANSIQEGKIVTGLTIKDITQEKLVGQNVIGISVAIFKYQEMLFGPVTAEWSEVERAEKFTKAVKMYIQNLLSTIEMMKSIYEPENLHILRQEHPRPRLDLGLGNHEFRLAARKAGEFLLFFQSLVDLIPMDADMVQTIGQVIVDLDAVGKKALIPSLVTVPTTPHESMPGYFPDEKPSLMEEVPIKDLSIQPLYEYRYPSPDPSEADSTPGEPGDYRLIAKPKGILKASKAWNAPSTPKYVPTPQKSRKLVFESPISKFIAPSHIPSRVMTAKEAGLIVEAERKAELLGDEHSLKVLEATMTVNSRHDASQDQFRWSLRGHELEKDDREMGLTRHHDNYGKFLDDTREDLRLHEERKRKQQEQEERSIYRMTPLKREVRIPRPPQFTAAERKRRAALAAASMPSPEPDSPISFSPWDRLMGKANREEPAESEEMEELTESEESGEEGMALAKPARTKTGSGVKKPIGRKPKELVRPVSNRNRPPEPATRKPTVAQTIIQASSGSDEEGEPMQDVQINPVAPGPAGRTLPAPKTQPAVANEPSDNWDVFAHLRQRILGAGAAVKKPAETQKPVETKKPVEERKPVSLRKTRETTPHHLNLQALVQRDNLAKEARRQRQQQQSSGSPRSASEQLFPADDEDADFGVISITSGLTTAASEAEKDEILTKVQIKKEEEAAARRRIEEAEAAAKKKKREEEEAKKKAAEEAQAKLLTPAALKQKRLSEATALRAPLKPLIRPLIQEWAAKVDAIPQQDEKTILAETAAGPLGRHQLYEQLTMPDDCMVWLNDQVITGSLAHLEKAMNEALGATPEQPLVVCFDNYFWTTRITERRPFTPATWRALKKLNKITPDNVDKIEYLLFPICHNKHWTLGVIRPRLKVVAHLNSMHERPGNNIRELLYLAQTLGGSNFVQDEWQDVSRYYNSPHQIGGDDCGVCTITNAECVVNGIHPRRAWQANDMKLPKRRMIAAMLLNGGYTGEFSLEGV